MRKLAGATLPAVQALAAAAALAGLYLLAGLAWTLLTGGLVVLASTTAAELAPRLRRPATRPAPHAVRARAGVR